MEPTCPDKWNCLWHFQQDLPRTPPEKELSGRLRWRRGGEGCPPGTARHWVLSPDPATPFSAPTSAGSCRPIHSCFYDASSMCRGETIGVLPWLLFWPSL